MHLRGNTVNMLLVGWQQPIADGGQLMAGATGVAFFSRPHPS